MKTLIIVFLILYGAERLLETFWTRKTIRGNIESRYTLHLLIASYVLLYSALIWETVAIKNHEFSPFLTLLGLVVVVLAVLGRNWAIYSLGPFHSIHIEIRDEHTLIQSGPYKYVRNPYYLSVILEALGLPLFANASRAALISIFLYLPILTVRILVEENALEGKFRGSFLDYKNRVPRIFPRIL